MDHFKKFLGVFALIFASPAAFAALAVDDFYIIEQDSTFNYLYPYVNDVADNPVFPGADDFQLISGQATLDTIEGLNVIPDPGYVGLIEIDYTITDANGSDQGRITVDVQGNPAAFLAVDDFFHVLENDVAIPMFLHSNDRFDFQAGALVSAVGATSAGGTVTITNDMNGDIEYQPPANYTGLDTFTYTLQDQATGASSEALVTVYVGVEPGYVPGPSAGLIQGLTEEEQESYDVLVDICAHDTEGELPCEEFGTLDDQQLKDLVQQLAGRHVKLQSRTLRTIRNDQGGNIRSRIREIRSGANQVSVNGLNATIFGQSTPLAQAFQSELNETLSGGAAGDNFITPWGFFINGNVAFGESDNEDDRPDYEQDGYNVSMGVDYRFSESLVAGVAAGFSRADMEFRGDLGEQDTSSYSLSLFGNYYPTDDVYVDGLLMYVDGGLDVDRRISVGSISQNLSSDTDSQQIVLSTSAGYEFSWQKLQGSVYGRVEYSDLTIDAYSERGGSLALAFEEQDTDSLDAAIGGRVGYVFSLSKGVIVPNLELEYVRRREDDFLIQSRFLNTPTAGSFTLLAEEQDTSYMNLSTSLSAVFSGGRSGFFRYETMLGQSNYDVSAYTLGFRMEF